MDDKFIVITWGCQMNEDDSKQIASLLMQMGYTETNDEAQADIAVLVTCSVREKPENKAKSKLGELRLKKQEKPDMIIGVCGCMAQREGKNLRRRRPYLDFVIGTAQIYELPAIIEDIKTNRRFLTVLDLPTDINGELPVPKRTSRTNVGLREFVPVMYGCNNFCAYCVVPYVRGRERSRTSQDIISEINDLSARGLREVTLLGQNVNSYGATLDDGIDFADLLYLINDSCDIDRIRFTTSHPKDLSDKVVYAMRDCEKVCEHIHLAVQSGDDNTLMHMNRKYTSDHLRERIATLRSAVPGVAITTDFLVGFPGESEEELENTLAFAREIRFDAAFMFSYNIIPGTPAAAMDGQMTMREKNMRLERLIEIQNKITCEINASEAGSVAQVLVCSQSAKDDNMLSGYTRTNKIVNFAGDKSLIGSLADVRLTGGHLYGFTGEIV